MTVNPGSNEEALGSKYEQDQLAFRQNAERFGAFLANTNQKVRTQEAIIAGIQDVAPDAWQALGDQESDFDVLYVGAGNGGLEIPLTEKLLDIRGSDSKFEVFWEDPSAEMEAQFREKLKAHDGLMKEAIVKEYSPWRFEDPNYNPPGALLVVSSHVWYYVGGWRDTDDPNNSLIKFSRAVKSGGTGLITLQSTASDRFRLRTLYIEAIGSDETELSGEEIQAKAVELQLPTQVSTIESETDVASCFRGGIFNPTDEGKLLLSFMLRAGWDDLNPKIQRAIAEELKSMVDKNGGYHMKFIDSALWITSEPATV